jgi:hypothetical protein
MRFTATVKRRCRRQREASPPPPLHHAICLDIARDTVVTEMNFSHSNSEG